MQDRKLEWPVGVGVLESPSLVDAIHVARVDNDVTLRRVTVHAEPACPVDQLLRLKQVTVSGGACG